MDDFQRIDGLLSEFRRHLRASGLARGSTLHREDFDNVIVLRIDTFEYGWREYRLTHHEIMMGGHDAVRHWLETIDHDVRARAFRHDWATNRYEASPRMDMWTTGADRADWDCDEPRFPQADKRAADLFLLTAGEKAFDTLQKGEPLPLTGSQGTAYTLHKRASFCVERMKDGASLCAVVPGVPLWDHLLGIKLMIENDEPRFLKIANVARSASRDYWRYYPTPQRT